MKSQRLDVRKTYKLYVGGQFVRSESGRCLTARSYRNEPLDNYCWASRKDFRDAVVAARGAFEGWAKRTAHLRGQILYRTAEMLENRAAELAAEITCSTGQRPAKARAEVALAGALRRMDGQIRVGVREREPGGDATLQLHDVGAVRSGRRVGAR